MRWSQDKDGSHQFEVGGPLGAELGVCRVGHFGRPMTEEELEALRNGDDVLRVIAAALRIVDQHPVKIRARIHRHCGEVFERHRRLDEAIEQYERALEHDPLIGVKTKLKAMRKERDQANRATGGRDDHAARHNHTDRRR